MKLYNKFIYTLILGIISISVCAQENTIEHIGNDSIKNIYLNKMHNSSVFQRQPIDIDEQTLREVLDKQASFAVYKDSYIATGIPLNERTTRSSADALIQFSIRQRLTKSTLPFNSFLYMTYTQRSFWNIYDESSPFRDTNYNPGLGIGQYIVRNNTLKGAALIQFQHQSNGQDGVDSRSWNFLSISAKYFYNMRLSAVAEVWVPFVDGENNKDLMKYKGYGRISLNYISKNSLWWYSTEITPRRGFGNFNINASLSYKISNNFNQYLFLQVNHGYAESLLNYNKLSSQVRIGFVIKPDFFSVY